jgi:ABC-type amino acid transport substrate-binding protein
MQTHKLTHFLRSLVLQVMCEDMADPAAFTGYQVALWREIAQDLGLQETNDWVFSCVDWNMMIEDLASPNGSCSFGAAGVSQAVV